MTLRYEVVPGAGLVARYADSILWVAGTTDPTVWETLGAVLQLAPGDELDGSDTACSLGAVQQVLEQYPHTAFAALLIAEDRAQGLLRGPVTVRNETESAPAAGHGQLGITVPFTMSQAVYVGSLDAGANPQPLRGLFDLDGGAVPGAGAWVHPLPTGRRHASTNTGTHPQALPVEPQASESQGSESQDSGPQGSEPLAAESPAFQPHASQPQAVEPPDHPVDPQPADPLGAPAPTHAEPAEAHAVPAEPQPSPAGLEPPTGRFATPQHPAGAAQPLPAVDASGAWASPVDAGAGAPADGHPGAPQPPFTPAADYARVDLRDVAPDAAAVPLPVAEPPAPAPAPHTPGPSVGAIVFEDGSTFALDRDYVIGRRPEKDPRVQSGQAAALTVADPDTVLSSAHALLSVRGAQVSLTDLGSLNGTHIAPPGAQDWTRLEQHREVPIAPGTRLLFGWTVATYSGGR